jgi:hypothetical protein
LNNTESEIGCLYAGVPQGSVLAILFPIYINDIADHTDGICRLFADEPYLHHKTSMTKESDFKSSHNTMVYFN